MQNILVNGVEYRLFDHIYAVSKSGDVVKNFVPCELTAHPMGYLVAGSKRLVHRMVAICWLEKPEGSNHVHHKDGDKTNNHIYNLEWLTPKQHIGGHHKRTGQKLSEATKQKIRESHLGKVTSEATKQKQREASLRSGTKPIKDPNYRHSEATKAKMSANHGKKVACIVHGVEYPSFVAAGIANGERPLSLRKRCYSKYFASYQLLG